MHFPPRKKTGRSSERQMPNYKYNQYFGQSNAQTFDQILSPGKFSPSYLLAFNLQYVFDLRRAHCTTRDKTPAAALVGQRTVRESISRSAASPLASTDIFTFSETVQKSSVRRCCCCPLMVVVTLPARTVTSRKPRSGSVSTFCFGGMVHWRIVTCASRVRPSLPLKWASPWNLLTGAGMSTLEGVAPRCGCACSVAGTKQMIEKRATIRALMFPPFMAAACRRSQPTWPRKYGRPRSPVLRRFRRSILREASHP